MQKLYSKICFVICLGICLGTSVLIAGPEQKYNEPKIDVLIRNEKADAKSGWDIAREWILAVSAAGSILGVAYGIWQSLRDYRLKLKEDARLAESTRIESDIKLIKHFTEIMDIAHARKNYQVSEAIIEQFFKINFITEEDKKNEEVLASKIKQIHNASIITLPVGLAAQEAAITAIANLAMRHNLLKEPAIQALNTISSFDPKTSVSEIARNQLKRIT